jgi:hypothetical protein
VQVSIDSNAALTAALAGLASLPEQFSSEACGSPEELAKQALVAYRATRGAPRAVLEDEAPDSR